MWFAIISEDYPGSLPLRKLHRPAHLARLQSLVDEQRLLIAGPHPLNTNKQGSVEGFSGSLVVADFSTLEEARAWADQDPYVLHGIYQQVTVKPFIKVLPE